jgi:tetratricopeptide (TPR) repeat protein
MVHGVSRGRLFLAAGVSLLLVGAIVFLIVLVVTGPGAGTTPTVARTTSTTLLADVLPGQALLRAGDVKGARKAMEAHLQQNPDDLRVRFLLALSYERAGDKEGAIRSYRDITTVDPQSFEAYYHIGQLQRSQGKVADARASFAQSLELNRDFTASRVALAETSAQVGSLDQAIKLYFEVIQMHPMGTHLDQIRTSLAKLLVKAGQAENAVIQAQKALAENPDNAEAKKLLNQLKPSSATGAGTTTTSKAP